MRRAELPAGAALRRRSEHLLVLGQRDADDGKAGHADVPLPRGVGGRGTSYCARRRPRAAALRVAGVGGREELHADPPVRDGEGARGTHTA